MIEGELAVQRALAAGAPITTIAATAAHAERIDPRGAELVVLSKAQLAALTGFPFHRGVLAAMPRPQTAFDPALLTRERVTIVAPVGLADPANVGAIIRTARAFGADLVVTDTDPFTRKAIRASAGWVFEQTIWHVPGIGEALDALGVPLAALTPDAEALPLHAYERPPQLALLFGNEGDGLPPEILARAQPLRIPIARDVDSLNVTAAAAIALHALA